MRLATVLITLNVTLLNLNIAVTVSVVKCVFVFMAQLFFILKKFLHLTNGYEAGVLVRGSA